LKKIAFLFPGQGSQSVGMGQDIYQEFEVVREIFDMASDIAEINLSKLCFKGPMEDLTQTINLQPAITAVNLGMLTILEKESLAGEISAGHSLSEYSALCAGGAISKEDTIRLVIKRGELMHREATQHLGTMHAIVGLPIDTVQEIVDGVQQQGVVSVANHNTETQIVITGSPDPVAKVSARAEEQGARAIPLKVSGAWHSELMRGAQDEFRAYLETIRFEAPARSVIMNVTADVAEAPDEIRDIMTKQLCSPVKWYDSIKKMMDAEIEIFAEIGPGRVLSGLVKKILPVDYPAEIFTVIHMKTLVMFLTAVKCMA
jgi:[acyl-carrier-protein] S-malonyltransferase